MSNNNLTWHPKFSFYNFENTGVLLVNETQFFWLPNKRFPSISIINNSLSLDEIINNLSNDINTDPNEIAQFIYQTNQLKKQTFLIDDNQVLKNNYQVPLMSEIQCLYQDHQLNILSVSTAPISLLSQWKKILKSALNSKNLIKERRLCFLLVDDLLGVLPDKHIENTLQEFKCYCVIKITGNKITFSPILYHVSQWRQLKSALYRNQPVRQLLTRILPEQKHVIPFEKIEVISEGKLNAIHEILLNHLTSDSKTLLQYDLQNEHTSQHLLHLNSKPTEENLTQFSQQIVLHSVKPTFNKDGGSRTISPATTVKKLMPFVDAITGYIPNIQELSSKNNDPIKIYRTAFFKTPLVKNLDTLDNDDFIQSCLGKGVTHEQSQASALCEAIERLNAQYQGNEPLFQSKPENLAKRYIIFQELTPYSTAQYVKFSNEKNPESKRKQAAQVFNNESIYWLPTWSLTRKEQVYVPLTCCFANIEISQQQTVLKTLDQKQASLSFNDDRFGRWHSNGAAAGNTLEEAILQALFELIERDAAAIWWYNKIERPAFDLTKIDIEYYQPLEQTLSKNHNYWVLDLTNDLGIPAMVAVGKHKENKGFILGFGCHLQPELAAQRALTELCQLIPIRDQNSAPFDFNAIEDLPYLYSQQRHNAEMAFTACTGDIKGDIDNIVARLESFNFEALVLDYTREPIPIHTAKVFIPGLCHIWPQLANERLYKVPVKMGWLKRANTEKTLNQQALYI